MAPRVHFYAVSESDGSFLFRRSLYEESVPGAEATPRAAKPSRPSYQDDGCDLAPTRSPRESYAALDSDDVATRFARPSAHAIADSDEVATRYGRPQSSSFADSDDAATRCGRPAAQSFVAPAEN